jgi:hypothetical protein
VKVNTVVMNRVVRHTILYAAFTLLTVIQVHAQHYNCWLRTTIQTNVATKWRNDAELQLRRQSMGNDMNMLEYRSLYSFRDWVYYSGSKHWRFGVSPVGYFGAYKTTMVAGDELTPIRKEYRVSAMAEYERTIYNKLKGSCRYAAESRWFDDGSFGLRQRIRPGIHVDRGRAVGVSAYYELLVNTTPTVSSRLIDQHRVMLSTLLSPGKNCKTELGLMYVRRYAGALPGYMNEANIVLNISFGAMGKK